MSTRTTPNLTTLVEKTILKDLDRYDIKDNIKNTLQELTFIAIGKRFKLRLGVKGPSYKLRYQYALDFWREKTGNEQIEIPVANNLIKDLGEELNSKHRIYSEAEETSEILLSDAYFSKETKAKGRRATNQSSVNEKPVWYVTCKCENKFYVKSANNCEAENGEIEVNMQEIMCSYKLICPGDEVKVIRNCLGNKESVQITKSTGLERTETHDAKANFIGDILKLLLKDESSLTVFDKLCKRNQGIWDHIKNDEELFKDDIQCVKDVVELSFLLSKKLSKKSEIYCERFLEDLTSSLFFIVVLPQFVQNNASELDSVDSERLKSLLELMMQFSPQTAAQIWNVAEHLANAIEDNSKCQGVKYLADLGKVLAKKVSGFQDVDTTNCKWNELPTIPTEKEILAAFDLKSLEAIKRKTPYTSTEEYLDINYRLLREECFRNLCDGIQNFRENHTCDTQKMKMYRITLHRITGGKTQIFLLLNCMDYYEKENSLEEEEDTSNEILYGSLMCISLDKKFDRLIWATVVKCYPRLHAQSNPNSNIKTVPVRLCSDRNKMKNIDVLLELSRITNEGDHALMAESPTFYSAFGPCMDRFKKMLKKDDMPLVDELVFAKKSDPPKYTHDKEQKCDWSIIFKKPSGYDFTFPQGQKLSPIEQFKHLQETMGTSQSLLDETQMLAIKNFLENRVSLIQGPPGTGKSFLGARILRMMLSMGIHKRGPILVMTYKNFALDNFLESCLEYSPDNIVRIGKAGNEKLSEINLSNVGQGKGNYKGLLSMDREATEIMRSSQSKLKMLFNCLSNPVSTFTKAASQFHIRSLLTKSENLDQNIDEATVDRLLRKWEQNVVSNELKECLKKSLKRWLPETKMRGVKERRQNYTKKPNSGHGKKTSVSPSSTDDEEECLEDAIDRKVAGHERLLDALEDDVMGGDLDTSSTVEDIDDNEPLTDDIKIPFLYRNDRESAQDVEEELNLWTLSDEERLNFICALQCKIVLEFSEAVKLYEENAKCHQDFLDDCTVNILKEYDVIGMTVTGAATRLHLLDLLKPCAVIVEEAAEIIEGQLIAVLPPSIEHLVMLGDQEQLQPRVNCYKLTQKNLDCSMFERLINNKMPFQKLGIQCRMRDDVADLLRSLNIYKDLKTNKEKTCNNKPPDCIGGSLYFVKHMVEEKEIKGSNSLFNQKEIFLILDVAVQLMKNGYPPEYVTVLCAYRGQVGKMNAAFKEKSSDSSEEYFTKLKDINITTVDSFQGEENKVILLSLVRSNKKDRIGFFKTKNRICVAISRAQCALYIFGNSSLYSSCSKNWQTIIEFLRKKRLVVRKFPFKEESDGIDTAKDEEPVYDTTKLSHRELTRLSLKIVGKYSEIAGLANLGKDEVENVYRDHINYSEPKDKANQILTMISAQTNFSRKELGDYLKEAGLRDLVDDVVQGTLRRCPDDAGSPNETIPKIRR